MMKQEARSTIQQKHVTDNTKGADVIYSINHNDQKYSEYEFKIQTDEVTILYQNSKLYMSNIEFLNTPVFTLKIFNNNDELDMKLHCTKYEDEKFTVKEDEENKINEYHFYPKDLFPKLRTDITWEADRMKEFIKQLHRFAARDKQTNIKDDKNVESIGDRLRRMSEQTNIK